VIRFGRFTFDPADGVLRREDVIVRLQPQPAKLLALLLERAGETVTRDELRQRLWGDRTFVDFDRGLNFSIAQIRSALGDVADQPRFIATVPRRGYRFIAPIVTVAPLEPPTEETASHPAQRGWRLSLLAAAVLAFGIAAAVVGRPWDVPPGPVPERVAVVPFDNETGDGALDRVANGISDATVARLSVPELIPRIAVIGNAAILRTPRQSRDLKAIGATLGAEYVVLGQLKHDGERFRVVAHLIRSRDEVHVWASTFDRPAMTLDVQSELATRIAGAVAAQLTAR